MIHALEWFLFGMLVWGCCIVLQAMQRRFAPDTVERGGSGKHRQRRGRRARDADSGTGHSDRETQLQEEIGRLRKRIETLEAIVTDRKYQWDQELRG